MQDCGRPGPVGPQGAQGEPGLAGAAGTSCQVAQGDERTATITCGDGSEATIQAPIDCDFDIKNRVDVLVSTRSSQCSGDLLPPHL